MGPRHPPFGLPSQSTRGAAAGSTTQPIQWSSEFYDSELVLVYYNYRHYNPVDGRWIVRDAIHEAAHNQLYIFSCNNSLYTRDYLGLRTIIYQENSVRGGRVFNAYDVKLEQINPLSKTCELELSIFIQFFFTSESGI